MASLVLDIGGKVSFCTRSGCQNHTVEIEDLDNALRKFHQVYGFESSLPERKPGEIHTHVHVDEDLEIIEAGTFLQAYCPHCRKSLIEAEMLKLKLKENHFYQIQFREKALSEINNRLVQVQSNLDQIYDDKLDGLIDEETFHRKRAKFLAEQKELDSKVEKHRIADKKYVDFGCLIFDVAHLASGVFKVRKPDEKRYLLNFVFSNLSLRDGTVQNSLRDIFQAIAEYQKTKNVLGRLDSNQNKQIQSLLSYH